MAARKIVGRGAGPRSPGGAGKKRAGSAAGLSAGKHAASKGPIEKNSKANRDPDKGYGRAAALEAIAATTSDAVISVDHDRIVRYWNPGAARLFGYTETEAVGRHIELLIVPDELREEAARFAASLRSSRASIRNEAVRSRKDGSRVPVSIHAAPVLDRSGAVLASSIVFRDVTETRNAEAARGQLESKMRLGALVGGLGLGSVDYLLDTLTLDETAAALFHLPPDKAVPRTEAHTRFHPDDAPRIEAGLAAALDPAGDGFFALDHRILRPDGSVRWVTARKRIHFSTAAGGGRRPVSGVLALRDISDRKEAERVSKEKEARLKLGVTLAGIGLGSIDYLADEVTLDESAAALLGQPAGIPIARKIIHSHFYPDDLPLIHEQIRRSLDPLHSGFIDFDHRVFSAGGAVRWVSSRVLVEFAQDENGDRRAVAGLLAIRDVSERKAADESTRESEKRLRTAANAAGLTYLDVDIASGSARAAGNFAAVMGYALPAREDGSTDFAASGNALHEHAVAADRALVDSAQTSILAGARCGGIELRVLGDDGAERWIESSWSIENSLDGEPLRAFVTNLDISERKRAINALKAAKREAEQATAAKSHFLAAASHDLRQPLQSLVLLQGMLAKIVEGERGLNLVGRLGETLLSMSEMLNALLDINQIEAGAIQTRTVAVTAGEIFERLRQEFETQARAKKLEFRIVPCRVAIQTDPRLLEQLLRNLLSNALKYTKRGKVLLGCRRGGGVLRIDICDTGIGIPETDLVTIFDEYRQLDNSARERSRGLGLGLSIARSMAGLLGCKVRARSKLGRGSVFSIEVPCAGVPAPAPSIAAESAADGNTVGETRVAGKILIVEDDPEIRELLAAALAADGHRVASARDGESALAAAASMPFQPEIVLTDFNLPNGMNGLQLAARLRERIRGDLPVIVLTGDITSETLRGITAGNCVKLNKPVDWKELNLAVQSQLRIAHVAARSVKSARPAPPAALGQATVFVVDDDPQIRESLREALEDDGKIVKAYPDCESFLAAHRPIPESCLLIDAYLPGMSGVELLQHLSAAKIPLPAIMITGNSDVAMAVRAMKAGALDFIEKPIGLSELAHNVERALAASRDIGKTSSSRDAAVGQVASLTHRERQIMDMVIAGSPSKNIAADLGISQRTVENHRASVMRKTGARSIPALARVAFAAGRT